MSADFLVIHPQVRDTGDGLKKKKSEKKHTNRKGKIHEEEAKWKENGKSSCQAAARLQAAFLLLTVILSPNKQAHTRLL